MKGFSLIEVMVVVALLGILSSSVVYAINPIKRIQQARDADRRIDIATITDALAAYNTINGQYPEEVGCDSSIGSRNGTCPPSHAEQSWDINSSIYTELVDEGLLKNLPTDPINDDTYHYRYEPRGPHEDPCRHTNQHCNYWVGGRLENPKDPTKPIYRCSDIESLPDGYGCKEVDNFYN